MNEEPRVFDCHGASLVGVLHRPAGTPRKTGVLIVVGGGPQYRVGGHRQLVLWARRLSAEGYSVFRFDYRGMGDSHGDFLGFEDADDDLRSAADHFSAAVPELENLVLWGECDASSAILFYAYQDPRVGGLVLLNPWVHTEAGRAQAVLKYYYLKRLTEPSFWRKVLGGKFNPFASLKSVAENVAKARAASTDAAPGPAPVPTGPLPREWPLPAKMLAGFTRFRGPSMLVMSGRDIIAREFDTLIMQSDAWRREIAAKPLVRHDLPDADHTFSTRQWRDQVVEWGIAWLERHFGNAT